MRRERESDRDHSYLFISACEWDVPVSSRVAPPSTYPSVDQFLSLGKQTANSGLVAAGYADYRCGQADSMPHVHMRAGTARWFVSGMSNHGLILFTDVPSQENRAFAKFVLELHLAKCSPR
jgi:hypothetical protein